MNAAPGRLRPRERIELGDYPVDAAWSSDGKTLAVAGGEGALLLLTLASPPQPQAIGRHDGGVLAVAWQAAGRLFASSGQDGIVQLWDARSLDAKAIHRSKEWSERLAFADSGRLLAVSTGRTLHLFDQHGQVRHSLAEHAGAIAALAWRPKSAEIAAAGNGGVRIHRLEPRPESRDYPWRGACLTASWNADGRVLATGMQDGSVHLWNVASGDESEMPDWAPRFSRPDGAPTGDFSRPRQERHSCSGISAPRGRNARGRSSCRLIPSAFRRWPSAPAAAGWCRRRATVGCCYGASARQTSRRMRICWPMTVRCCDFRATAPGWR
ncbi:MAG TPA: hypothetical protein VN925_06890 [Steroidobacteraceae bacterium]|nr:hypothetical protein [Steroidobacteraceae bacterium]